MKVSAADVPGGDAAPTDVQHPPVKQECSSSTACDFELCIRTGFCLQLSTFGWLCLLLVFLASMLTANKDAEQKIQLSRLGRGSRLGHQQAEGNGYNMAVKRSSNILIYWHPKASGMLTKGNNNNKKATCPNKSQSRRQANNTRNTWKWT